MLETTTREMEQQTITVNGISEQFSMPIEVTKVEKGSPVPKSPRKISENLTCAVINKSELRSTKNGKMFSMNRCDQSSKAKLRAVCFNQRMFPNFEPSKSYDISSFKIMKAFSDGESVEILLDGEVNSATTQVPVIRCSNLKIKDILAPSKNPSRFINLVAKVMTIHEPCEVGTFPAMKMKREITVGDFISIYCKNIS